MGIIIMLIFAALAVLGIIYVVASIVTIQADQKAVVFIWGRAVRVIGPGLHFCPLFISSITRYGMEPLVFKIKVPTAITKNGKVRDYKEDGDEVERTEVDIFLTLITYFSDDNHELLNTAKRASGDYGKILGSAIMPYVEDLVRATFGEMPWVLSYQERKCLLDYILSKLIPEYEYFGLGNTKIKKNNVTTSITYFFDNLDSHGVLDNSKLKKGETEIQMARYNPLVQFGLDTTKTTLMITDINFCDKELAKMLSASETARMKSETDRIKLMREVDTIKKKGFAEAEVMMKKGAAAADARKRMVEVIKGNVDLEFLRSLEEMAKGTSNTILYQIPGAFEDRISKMLGGNKPLDLLNLLKDPAILQTLKDAIKKITQP